ncbi:unnamed protein product [Pedinophyceae sp. YPF-701]|nr:unnamed protein product [Pedinophyceae sp. YPF-701]
MATREDIQRLMVFDQARAQAEADARKDPNDAGAYLRWGGALLEIATMMPPPEAARALADSRSKVERCLELDPNKHQAHWVLANNFATEALNSSDEGEAERLFAKASQGFNRAVELDPENEVYKKSAQMQEGAMAIWKEMHSMGGLGALAGGGPRGGPAQANEGRQGRRSGLPVGLILLGGDGGRVDGGRGRDVRGRADRRQRRPARPGPGVVSRAPTPPGFEGCVSSERSSEVAPGATWARGGARGRGGGVVAPAARVARCEAARTAALMSSRGVLNVSLCAARVDCEQPRSRSVASVQGELGGDGVLPPRQPSRRDN